MSKFIFKRTEYIYENKNKSAMLTVWFILTDICLKVEKKMMKKKEEKVDMTRQRPVSMVWCEIDH